MKSASAVPESTRSALVVTRNAMRAVVATACASAFTIAGASCGCASRCSEIEGDALGDGCGEGLDDGVGVGDGVGEGDGVPVGRRDALALGLGDAAGSLTWRMQLYPFTLGQRIPVVTCASA